MSNYLSPFERWQTERFGNFYPEKEPKEVEENYEYKNTEWVEKQADKEFDQN